jgi:hypothetical protein
LQGIATLNAGGGFAGHTDWRVPNIIQLDSLKNFGAMIPATWPAFNAGCAPACTVLTCSCTVSAYYWSPSPYAGSPRTVDRGLHRGVGPALELDQQPRSCGAGRLLKFVT